MLDLIIRNGRLVDPVNGRDGRFDIAVEDGRVVEVSEEVTGPAREEIDAAGRIVMPGIVDMHTHMRITSGHPHAQRMIALAGVCTTLDMAGPLDDILDSIPESGAGVNIAVIEAARAGITIRTSRPDKAERMALIDRTLENGGIGIKLLGGHFPMDLDVSEAFIGDCAEARAWIAWHVGSTKHGSNIEGLRDAVAVAGDRFLHVAHVNSYCRGQVSGELEEAILTGRCGVLRDNGTIGELVSGEEGVRLWEAKGTDVSGSFAVNPAVSRFLLAQAKRDDGSFVVDAFSTDGGCYPRNVIVENGLLLVHFGALTLGEFVVKASVNGARALRLPGKGHLGVGADADISILDFERRKAFATIVNGSVIMHDGRLLGKGTGIVCDERGEAALRSRGIRTIVRKPHDPAGIRSRFIPS